MEGVAARGGKGWVLRVLDGCAIAALGGRLSEMVW